MILQQENLSSRRHRRANFIETGVFAMFDKIFSTIYQQLRYFTLWGYGWKRRKLSMKSPAYQWRDPFTGLWYGEKVAMKLLMVNALEYYRR